MSGQAKLDSVGKEKAKEKRQKRNNELRNFNEIEKIELRNIGNSY